MGSKKNSGAQKEQHLRVSNHQPPRPGGKGAEGLGAAISAVVGAIVGQGEGFNGTVNGKRGFQPGNTFGSKAHRNQSVTDARHAHTQARALAGKHIRAARQARTPLSTENRRAIAASAAAHRTLMQARQTHLLDKNAARRSKAMQARIERSTSEVPNLLAGRAADRISELRRKSADGSHTVVDTLAGVHKLARGANKAELFTAANLVGIKHEAKTKGALVDHLAAHLIRGGKAQTNRHDLAPSERTDHSPGHVGYLNTDLIHADPVRFQYKIGSAAKSGSVGSLEGVHHFDHDLSGIVQVWKDPGNGKVFDINGHNRLDKAKELGENKITVRFIKAKDAKEARSIGAASNIAEGHGSAIDAGKFFASSGLTREQVQAKGITFKGKVASDGLALAQLQPSVFQSVIDGHLPLERAVIIGGSGLTHAQQKATLDLATAQAKKKGGKIDNEHLRELIDAAKSAPVKTRTTTDLFGTSEEDVSLLLHRSKLAAQIKEKLASDKRVFGTVSKAKNAEKLTAGGNVIDTAASAKIGQEAADALVIFDQLKHRSGPVARALNEGSERLYGGETPAKVLADVYRKALAGVREEIQ